MSLLSQSVVIGSFPARLPLRLFPADLFLVMLALFKRLRFFPCLIWNHHHS